MSTAAVDGLTDSPNEFQVPASKGVSQDKNAKRSEEVRDHNSEVS